MAFNLDSLPILQKPIATLTNLVTMPQSRQSPKTVYLLPLNDDGSPDVLGSYIYLPPPSTPAWSIRFAIEGASSMCRQGSLWVNIPTEGKEFDRNSYREFK